MKRERKTKTIKRMREAEEEGGDEQTGEEVKRKKQGGSRSLIKTAGCASVCVDGRSCSDF